MGSRSSTNITKLFLLRLCHFVDSIYLVSTHIPTIASKDHDGHNHAPLLTRSSVILLIGIYITMLGASIEARNTSNVFVPHQAAISISGHVSDSSRNPIPDLQVELLNDVDSVIQRTKTDGSGLFGFLRLSEGIFQIRVQTYGTSYLGQTKRIQLERYRAFEQVDF